MVLQEAWARHEVEKAPSVFEAQYNLAEMLQQRGALDEAIVHFQACASIRPNDPVANNALGVALLAKGDLDGAVQRFNSVIAAQPDYFDAHYNMGSVLASQGNFQEAAKQFGEAVRLNPEDANAQANLGTALAQLGRLTEAKSHYEDALRLDPHNQLARENLQQIEEMTKGIFPLTCGSVPGSPHLMVCRSRIRFTLVTYRIKSGRIAGDGRAEVPFLFRGRGTVVAILLVIASAGFAAQSAGLPAGEPDTNGYVGNEACAKCHAEIFASYKNTAMAHASGPASENLIAGDFTHQVSGVNYRIYSEAGKVWLSFDRPGDPAVHGKRELLYYIGQGRRGRSYLFSDDGFVFESPVNWYTDRHMWDMAPAYGNVREIPMTLPALTSCLDCHVSGIRPPINGTENRYKMPVFTYGGVTCERCHGPGVAHVNGGAIVNPSKTRGGPARPGVHAVPPRR